MVQKPTSTKKSVARKPLRGHPIDEKTPLSLNLSAKNRTTAG